MPMYTARYSCREHLVQDVRKMGPKGWLLQRLTRLADRGYEAEFVLSSAQTGQSSIVKQANRAERGRES